MKRYLWLASFAVCFTLGCRTSCNAPVHHPPPVAKEANGSFPETFEAGSKKAYTAADVVLATGSWHLDDALIGTTAGDHKSGAAALRITGAGSATMNFDVKGKVSGLSIEHACYGTDPAATWQLWYSADGGATWAQAGPTITTTAPALSTTVFPLTINGTARFQVRKLTGGRINLDNFSIAGILAPTGSGGVPAIAGGKATRDDNMGMGNPSGASTASDNYLLVKRQYALSYNNAKGMANWVSWHLSTAWKGSAPRCNCFSPDGTLPDPFYKATTGNYIGTGYDRGHLCPSDDRDGSAADNAATFLMSNISPQAPLLNQQPWAALEMYCRSLITQGRELYIIAGGYGQGGSGSLGGTTKTIASGHINVPSHFWKVIVVLPIGTGDAARVAANTRVIAVDMPNQQSVGGQDWGAFRTSVDALEAATGYNFLSNVPVAVQAVVEARKDTGPTQ